MLFNVYLSLLFLCFVTGILAVYFNRRRPFYIKLFAWFIFMTLVIESTQKFFLHKYMQGLYNFYWLLSFAFFGYLLYQIIQSKPMKRIILIAEYVFLPTCLISIFYFGGFNHFHAINYLPGAILLILFSAYFLYELFFNSLNTKLIQEPTFWIALGILLFHSCSASIILAFDFSRQFLRVELKLLNSILLTINLLYYSLFTIAFLCVIKFPPKTSANN